MSSTGDAFLPQKFSAWDGDNEGGIETGIALFLEISYDQSLTTKNRARGQRHDERHQR
jgi:hypothetical protein